MPVWSRLHAKKKLLSGLSRRLLWKNYSFSVLGRVQGSFHPLNDNRFTATEISPRGKIGGCGGYRREIQCKPDYSDPLPAEMMRALSGDRCQSKPAHIKAPRSSLIGRQKRREVRGLDHVHRWTSCLRAVLPAHHQLPQAVCCQWDSRWWNVGWPLLVMLLSCHNWSPWVY